MKTHRALLGVAVGVLAGSFALTVAPSDAAACGGPFGPGYTVTEQKILVAHRDGTQKYVFQPFFCGQSESFGLVLPVPAALSANPTLAPSAVFADLAAITAPNVQKKTECRSKEQRSDFGGIDAGAGGSNGINVVGVGQVGIFDWALLQATSPASFTDWLDANGYPHTSSSDELFAHYVSKGWYFVAFKVSASASAPTAGKTLCGELGPIQLAFPATQPMVPARIAAAGAIGDVKWDVYTTTPGQALTPPASLAGSITRFSGDVGASTLATRSSLAGLVAANDHVGHYDVTLNPASLTDDLAFSFAAKQSIRETVYDVTYVDCEETPTPPSPSPSATNPPSSSSPPNTATASSPSTSGGNGGCAAAPTSSKTTSAIMATLGLALAMLVGRRRRAR